ncbi:Ribonuclease H [Spirochaeta thermophila DSM 6578]|uniref:Ribonuclease H n=1 Tax=Winmispira thermophila (strain ATCC 700085 / DSM 6578 / Z-1203) TaxID=869211 RepID=G0G9S7_WINT7|nr:ribonuclease HI [Spirochaeta thermophila]AEJ60827.1 Ribonuclease H [Spirochaeta thermophila DSM 6578]
MIEVYTDGACKGNPGPGGWAYVVVRDGEGEGAFGGERMTTNNRMELLAVIKALERVDAGGRVRVYTDSEYVRRGITEWIDRWLANGWKTRDRRDVKNRDLWERLWRLAAEVELEWVWVQGHAGVGWNEVCDRMAHLAALRAGG